MARVVSEKSKANLIPAVKGEVRNPEGGRSHDPAKKALKKLSNAYVKEVIEMALFKTRMEMELVQADPETPLLKSLLLKVVLDAERAGNWDRLKDVMETLLGKMPTRIDITSGDQPIGESPEDRASREKRIETYLKAASKLGG